MRLYLDSHGTGGGSEFRNFRSGRGIRRVRQPDLDTIVWHAPLNRVGASVARILWPLISVDFWTSISSASSITVLAVSSFRVMTFPSRSSRQPTVPYVFLRNVVRPFLAFCICLAVIVASLVLRLLICGRFFEFVVTWSRRSVYLRRCDCPNRGVSCFVCLPLGSFSDG